MGIVRLDVPVVMPRQWARLPGPALRLRMVGAILDTLTDLGERAGVGPPPLRPRPTGPAHAPALDHDETLAVGRWLDDQIESCLPGQAVLVAVHGTNGRRQAMRQRVVDRLPAHRPLPVPTTALTAWRVDVLPARPDPAAGRGGGP